MKIIVTLDFVDEEDGPEPEEKLDKDPGKTAVQWMPACTKAILESPTVCDAMNNAMDAYVAANGPTRGNPIHQASDHTRMALKTLVTAKVVEVDEDGNITIL